MAGVAAAGGDSNFKGNKFELRTEMSLALWNGATGKEEEDALIEKLSRGAKEAGRVDDWNVVNEFDGALSTLFEANEGGACLIWNWPDDTVTLSAFVAKGGFGACLG